ncbi:MAG: hypothetical protein JNL38_24980 [Myxococcales bacterium]|nr:hypothetical protein [Myxococcales bacterium]
MRRAVFAAVVLGCAWPAVSAGQPAGAPRAKPKAPDPPALTVAASVDGGVLALRVENKSEATLEALASASLLSLEITPPAPAQPRAPKKPAVRCAVDAPSPGAAARLVVPKGRSFTVKAPLAFLCFGARERAALAAGGSVAVRYGRGGDTVVTPIGGAAEPELAAVKELRPAPFDLPPAAPAAPVPAPPSPPASATLPPLPQELSIVGPERIDSARGDEIPITATVTNETRATITAYVRSATVGARVETPSGRAVSCGPSRSITPIRELYTYLPGKGRTQVSFRAELSCPEDTFDETGLYKLVPVLDTRKAAGGPPPLRPFEGVVWSTKPTEVRVRAGQRPPPRPALDPAP